MKTAIGGTQLFTIVIVLILLFTGYMCLSINYTAAYKIADSIVNQIQKDNGANFDNIASGLRERHYYTSGPCGEGWTAVDQNGVASKKGFYCIRKVKVSKASNELPDIYYYQIKVWFRVDAPFFSRFGFNVKADTANIYTPDDKTKGGNIIVVDGE